ncbi:MAG TPA: hypothetical protein PKA99_07290 [Dermatophilaceae bacterium]|nr:hypothetical protein [Dermatophilaceae bacterium]
MAEMRARDPLFFDRFGSAMTSGKRQRIAAGLQSAQDAMAAVASSHRGEVSDGRVSGTCVWAFAVVVVTLAAAGNVAYAVNAVRTGNVAWNVNWFWSSPVDTTSRLNQERWVNEIANTL